MNTRIVYVESICRVETLSLSGRILSLLADEFVVQWEEVRAKLLEKYPNGNVICLGRLS